MANDDAKRVVHMISGWYTPVQTIIGLAMIKIPNTPAQINPPFLTAILRSAGVLRQATVTAVQVEPLVAKTSYNAQMARLHLAYDRQEAEAPHSLIAKLPTADTDLHQNAAVFQPGAKESWFYRHGAARSPLNVPRCYFNAIAGDSGESVLLLQDLAPAQTGDWAQGVSPDKAELALRAIARQHAAWWAVDPAAVPELAHLMDNLEGEQDLVERLYAAAWPRFLEDVSFNIPDDAREFGHHLVGRLSAAEATLDGSPHTLMHGDFRLGNILFGLREGAPTCWVIDWEDIMLWNGMFDVAWFLGSCLKVTDSDAEQALVRSYHRQLTHEGVADYAWAQCYHDYRCAMLSAFVQGVLTAVPSESDDEYARQLTRAVRERFTLACQRLRLDELIPG